jgi:hypothetical protein
MCSLHAPVLAAVVLRVPRVLLAGVQQQHLGAAEQLGAAVPLGGSVRVCEHHSVPKVCQDDATVMATAVRAEPLWQQQVVALDVKMYDPGGVQHSHRAGHLCRGSRRST